MKKTGHVPGMVALHLPNPQCFHKESAEQNHREATQAKARQKANFSTGCMIVTPVSLQAGNQEDTHIPGVGSKDLGSLLPASVQCLSS